MGEPAILLESWSGGTLISLRQGDQLINLNRNTVEEIPAILKSLDKIRKQMESK